MRRKLSLIAAVLCCSLALGACSNKHNQTQTDPSGTSIDRVKTKLDVLKPVAYGSVNGLSLEPGSYISIIGRYSDDSYWKEVEAGAKQAVADLNSMLGYKGDKKIKLTYSAPEIRDDVNEQVNILDEELSREPIAIGIAAIDTTACTIQFDLASENNIPIITFDSGSDYKHVASHIATDNLAATQTAATQLAYEIEEEGEVVVFVQDSVSMTAKQRLQGFLDTISSKFPNIKIAETYRFDQLNAMREAIANEKNAALTEGEEGIKAESLSQEDVIKFIIEKYPNLKGIYATNLDTTQAVAKVLKNMEKDDLKFVGFDGGESQMNLLQDGTLNGLITQNPYGIGYATVVAAARVSLGLPNESFVNSGYTWVTKENMNLKEIKGMLY
ncbi:MAG: substrate-binding domain-containing protein [Tyzzerella sp.]|nr:substrate-binding domain-containing protein [Tyzzerella sp.]